ncbi:hypothetical protein QUB75_07390 [Microcoleus sp. K1-B6]
MVNLRVEESRAIEKCGRFPETSGEFKKGETKHPIIIAGEL